MRPVKALKKFFEMYTNTATVNHPEPQLKANQAARWFWNTLTSIEREKLEKTRVQALADKKKREEFNLVCKEVRRRLFK